MTERPCDHDLTLPTATGAMSCRKCGRSGRLVAGAVQWTEPPRPVEPKTPTTDLTLDQQRLTDALRPEYQRVTAALQAAREAEKDLDAQREQVRQCIRILEGEQGALVTLALARLKIDLRNANGDPEIPF